VGVEIQFAEDIYAKAYTTNAAVWHREGNSLFVSLTAPVTVSVAEEASCLRQVNLPAEITVLDDGAEITFLSDGMLQAVCHGKAETSSEGWTVTEQNGNTVFTKYGSADTLLIRAIEENN
jgi:hypothetical protein